MRPQQVRSDKLLVLHIANDYCSDLVNAVIEVQEMTCLGRAFVKLGDGDLRAYFRFEDDLIAFADMWMFLVRSTAQEPLLDGIELPPVQVSRHRIEFEMP